MDNEQLVTRINAGIDTAENMLQLYKQMKGLIYSIAKKYSGYAELEDLTQEGYIALCEAVRHYKPAAGAKFSSYAAVVIRRHMQRYVYRNSTLSMPEHMAVLLSQYRQLCSAFEARYDRQPSEVEVARFLSVRQEQAALLRKTAGISHVISLDSPIDEEDGEATICDTVHGAYDTEQEAVEDVYQDQMQRVVWEAVDRLPGQQAEVIRCRYAEDMTLQAVGDRIGATRERVRQEESKGMRALRNREMFLELHAVYNDSIYSKAIKGNGVSRFATTWTSSTERVALGL